MIVFVDIDEGMQSKCNCPQNVALHVGDQCVISVNNISEIGVVAKFSEGDVSDEEAQKLPKVLRRATLQDQAKADENVLMGKIAAKTCTSKADELGLKMRMAKIRYSMDRKTLSILFHAEERVDFRQLVKDLGHELRTRVDMKQIGVRDEAAIIGGMGCCGRQLCCCTWLSHFESINVKMAKSQRLSLNPSAISGVCGRLKCCLRYECDQYREADRHLPRDGARVECPDGKGKVIDKNLLQKRIRVKLDDDRVIEYDADDIKRSGGTE